VPPGRSRLRFYADESILGVGRALAIARRDLVHPGHPLIPEVPLGALDTVWMAAVAARGLVVLCRDRHIRTKPGELSVLRSHALRVFWLAGRRELTSWQKLVRLVMRWEDIERTLSLRGPGPWFMAVSERDVSEVRLA
jgi:hypothetical protein